MTHQRRIFLLALGAGLPGAVLSTYLLWSGPYPPRLIWTLAVVVGSFWLGCALAARERTIKPLRTLANLIEALREGDYSIRANSPGPRDALGEVMVEVNHLGDLLRRQRFRAVDAAQLLERVISEVDVALFTFDEEQVLRLVNRAGERLLARRRERLLHHTAEELGLADCLTGEPVRTFERSFAGGSGRWQSRRGAFREGGLPHQLVVLTDLSKALRDEERQAWQRLIRVLSHELNNSLAPIKSTASTLASLLRRTQLPTDWREDTQRGLRIIAQRSEALNRFVAAYSRLARLPSPQLHSTPIAALVNRVLALEPNRQVRLDGGPDLALQADPDQLEQLLINLVKNGVEAAAETAGEVAVGWHLKGAHLQLQVLDRGPGLASTDNLFVPFFTTKPEGTGIGLVLCRQIAEAHGGSLELRNRPDGGCAAILRLPA